MNISTKNLLKLLILFVSFISYVSIFVFYPYFYDKVFLRGYLEASMWLSKLQDGDYVREYYYIIKFMIDNFGLSLQSSVFILSTLSFSLCFFIFKAYRSINCAVSFIIVFNVFSVLLIYSAGRTSLSILLVVLCFYSLFPKVRLILFSFFASLLALIHVETLFIVFCVYSYEVFLKFADEKLRNQLLVTLYKALIYVFISLGCYFLLSSDFSYFTVTDGSGNTLNILLTLMVIILSYFFIGFEQSFPLFVIFILLTFVAGMNSSYLYRIIIFPMSIGFFYNNMFKKGYL